MSMANENFNVGGTGGSLFSDNAPTKAAVRPGQGALGDEYVPPAGLPGFKQPSFDDEDRVDPNKYPEPSGGGSTTFLSRFFPDPVQQGLALAKSFYFFFFAAFGSLFPLMAVYFKQQGMDAGQCGFLIGVRPIIEYLATPFWSKMSDKFQKGKVMLLVAVISWIAFTLPIGFVHPPVVSCKYYNGSQYLVKLPDSNRRKRSVSEEIGDQMSFLTPDDVEELPRALPLASAGHNGEVDIEHLRMKRNAYDHRWAPGYVVGTSPQSIGFASNYNVNKHKQWVSPAFSNEVFEKAAVHKVFFLVLLLVIIGEFFSSPAVALADSAVITLLGDQNQDKYGSQRMWGSIGWGVMMFFMGMVLDHSRFEHSVCDLHDGQKNYNVCFSVFAFLMFLAFIVATQIPFRYSIVPSNNVPMNNMGQPANGAPGGQKKEMDQKEKVKLMAEKTKVFATQLRAMPEFNAVFKAMSNLRLLVFMLTAWVMGIGIGLIFTFLFWHLQDFGGGPTLFGIASVINHMSEIAAYRYSFKIIAKYGHIKVLAAGLLCNCLRFLYISFITWPWLVLPFEFVQGITHAAVWAACCSFINHNTDAELRQSAQGFLQGIHHGFGKFCGAVFGGMLIQTHGTVMVFRGYGILCGVFLGIFVGVNIYQKDEGSKDSDDPDAMLAPGGMAPHGVPNAPMPRALSNAKLDEQESAAALAEQAAHGANLGVPGNDTDPGQANNPFLAEAADQGNPFAYNASGTRIDPSGQPGEDGQYYGRGYSQAQSGYSSSGFGLQ